MFSKYTYPIYIYLFFKNIPGQVYFNKSSSKNTLVSFLPNQCFNSIIKLYRNDLFLSYSYVAEATAFDYYKNINFLYTNNYSGLLYNINIFNYLCNLRILFLTNINTHDASLRSSDSVYLNLN